MSCKSVTPFAKEKSKGSGTFLQLIPDVSRYKVYMKLINFRPPQLAWILIGLSAGLHFVLPSSYRGQFSCWVCGAIAIGIGFGLMMWAWALFRQTGTPIRPTERAAALVRSGPFRFSRNPMYLGIVIMLLGIAAWVGSFPMLIATVGFFVFMRAVFIPYEEARLHEAFGEYSRSSCS
jgi:protein-S-isoprenylcysteine O-methyltransferase Ste14